MSNEKPKFALTRLSSIDSSEQLQVFTVDREAQPIDRRNFLRLGAAVPAALALGALKTCEPTETAAKGMSFTMVDKASGLTKRYTQACGRPLPDGATLVCSCVPGAGPPYEPPPANISSGTPSKNASAPKPTPKPAQRTPKPPKPVEQPVSPPEPPREIPVERPPDVVPRSYPGGTTIRRPCTPAPIPPGYTCTCNCIPG